MCDRVPVHVQQVNSHTLLINEFELVPYPDNPGVYSVWLGNVQQGAFYAATLSLSYRKLTGTVWEPLSDPPWKDDIWKMKFLLPKPRK